MKHVHHDVYKDKKSKIKKSKKVKKKIKKSHVKIVILPFGET